MIRTVHVKEHVHLAQVQKQELGLTRLDIAHTVLEDLFIGPMMIRISLVRHSCRSELVKDRRRAGDALFLVDIPFFHPIEKLQKSWADAALETRPHTKYSPA